MPGFQSLFYWICNNWLVKQVCNLLLAHFLHMHNWGNNCIFPSGLLWRQLHILNAFRTKTDSVSYSINVIVMLHILSSSSISHSQRMRLKEIKLIPLSPSWGSVQTGTPPLFWVSNSSFHYCYFKGTHTCGSQALCLGMTPDSTHSTTWRANNLNWGVTVSYKASILPLYHSFRPHILLRVLMEIFPEILRTKD